MLLKDGVMMIALKNENTGKSKNIATGFSILALIFSWWVPIFRGEFSIAGKIFGIAAGIAFVEILLNVSDDMILGIWCLVSIIIASLYNKWRIKRLINKGFVPADSEAKKWLDDNGIIVMGEVAFAEEVAPVENSDVNKEIKELCLSTAKEKANVKDDENTFVPPPPMK